ncbi:MAG: phosphoribosylformylglycinamidine cyclo-ligase [Thermaerobacter sp.]|jgi:phosphoribosylformylglycinamidine cyclo-ligase|nr:phosphoribosylformylglycinamidine cyclo-ligase [Thermaerobacter sp.]
MAGGWTYRRAGVDLGAAQRSVELIGREAATAGRPEVLAGVGGFGGLIRLPEGYRRPVLVAGCDGVGTKLAVAFAAGRHDTVGVDLVAMSVNDVLALGAEPLFFLDYLAVGRLDPEQAAAVVRGIARGCREAGCALLGGETAELPGFYPPGQYDLAGFAVGVVEADAVVDGTRAVPGDALIGLASAGLHSNGYSLARRLLLEERGHALDQRLPGLDRTLGEELLEPTRIYVKSVLALLKEAQVHALAHVTGGGIPGNLPRVLPEGVRARVRWGSWPQPAIFRLIQEAGEVEEAEMWRTFNRGLGFLAAVPPEQAPTALELLRAAGERAWVVGELVAGERGVDLE